MELVAEAGLERGGDTRCASEQGREDNASASLAGDDEVLVERCLKCASIRGAQDGIGPLDGVGDADAGFGLAGDSETVVEIAAQADVDRPVACRDLVLGVEG